MAPISVGTPEAAALLGFCQPQPGAAAPAAAANGGGHSGEQRPQPGGAEQAPAREQLRHSVEAGVAAGFQLAAAAGPLCDEPLWGVAVEARRGADGSLSRRAGIGRGRNKLRDAKQICGSALVTRALCCLLIC